MKTSQALRLTKSKLWDGKPSDTWQDYYCCDAARTAGVFATVSPILSRLISDHFGLETWLNARGYDPSDEVKLQETRHAWLDHLIEHFEALND